MSEPRVSDSSEMVASLAIGLSESRTSVVIAIGSHGVEIQDPDVIEQIAVLLRTLSLEIRNGGRLS